MDDISILIALLFALVLITLIGHGIWVLLAMIYRALTGGSESLSISINDSGAARTGRGALCAECGAGLQTGDSFCSVCGQARSSAGLRADLAMTARQLDKFLNQGRLDAEVHKLIIGLVEEERTRLGAPVHRDATATRRE